MKKYTLNVTGTHCNACKMLIEDVLGEEKELQNITVNLENKKINLETEEQDENKLVEKINVKLKEFNYTVSTV